MAYLLAALGGALGALARWALTEVVPSPGGWPWATLLVNLTGCFLLGALFAVVAAHSPEPPGPGRSSVSASSGATRRTPRSPWRS
jgi:CrcB protein